MKTSCNVCGSSDAREVYEDGQEHCFSCNDHTFPNNKSKGVVMQNESFDIQKTKDIDKNIRGISPATFKFYNYHLDSKNDHVINHFDKDGNIVAQKWRYKDKTFSWKGNTKASVPFGMNLWRSGGKRIIITEGELDCLSVAEALQCKYPVISINNGAQSAFKDLKEHIEFLNSYEEITLWFDNDAPGKEAIKKVVTLFPVGKVSIVQSPYKDANEVLQKEGKAGVIKYYYETKKYTPDGIVCASNLNFDNLIQFSSIPSFSIPYPKLNEILKGVRKRELVMFTAGSGIGKSTIVREIAYDLLVNQNCKIGYVALEESIQRTTLGLMGIHINSPIYQQDVMEQADKEKVKEAYDVVVKNGNLYLYDSFGSIDSENLLSKLRYLAVGLECDFIFLDHISIVISGTDDLGDSERRAIDILMTKLRSLAEETGVGIIAVTHLKRPQGSNKGYEDGLQISLSSLRGSGAIAQLSDAVVALERDQQGKEPDVATVRVLKNRYVGITGEAGSVKYFKDEGRLLPYTIENIDSDVPFDEDFKEEF